MVKSGISMLTKSLIIRYIYTYDIITHTMIEPHGKFKTILDISLSWNFFSTLSPGFTLQSTLNDIPVHI